MKKTTIAATFIFTMAILIASCGTKTSENKAEQVSSEQTESSKFQCPMKCEGDKTYEKAGQCPVCNMDLQEIKTEDSNKEHNH